jgi:hypothetical protein
MMDGEKEKKKKKSKESKEMDKTSERKARRLEIEKMDWEYNLEGADKLLYPGDDDYDDEGEESDEEMKEDLLSDMDQAGDKSEDEEVESRAEENSISVKAAAYLAKMKAKAETALNNYVDGLDMNRLEYEAVRRFKNDSAKILRTDGLEPQQRSVGSFVNTMDGRLYKTGISTSLAEKKTSSLSFNSETMECMGCVNNHSAKIWRNRGESADLTAEAFLLTDQSYPPVLPSTSEQSCVKIMRREDATIMELVNDFLMLTKGKEINKQGIILIHSLSHMARAGTEGYAEDLLLAGTKLRAALGQQLHVVPLPHLFLSGCTCPMTIRTAAEVAAWAAKVYGEEGKLLTDSFQLANYLISPKAGEKRQIDYERVVRLPASPMGTAARTTWIMSGFGLKEQVQPISEIAEKEIIGKIISELRTGMALKLDTAPDLDRMVPVKVGGGGREDRLDYLIIGRSGTAAKVAAALERAGKKIDQVCHPDWRLTSSYVARTAEEATAAIAAKRPGAVVVAGLDESYFMASYDDVHTLPATKDASGHYHIHGDLVVASKETQIKLARLMEPLWAATKGIKTVIVGPVDRYVTEGCCGDPDHMPNRKNDNFIDKMRSDVLAAKNLLKEQLYEGGHHHCRVIDMAMDMAGKKPVEIWGTDPTMPNDAIFDGMVAAMPSVEVRIDLTKKRLTKNELPDAKRIRLDSQAGGGAAPATAVAGNNTPATSGGSGARGVPRGAGGRGGGVRASGGGRGGGGGHFGGRGRGGRNDERWRPEHHARRGGAGWRDYSWSWGSYKGGRKFGGGGGFGGGRF